MYEWGEKLNQMAEAVMEEGRKHPKINNLTNPNFDVLVPSKVMDILRNRKQYDIETLKFYVERNLDLIFRKENISVFHSCKLLRVLETVITEISLNNNISTELVLSYDKKLNWCEYLYSYLTSLDTRESITELMIEITELLFKRHVNKFMSLGFSKKFSAIMVICRYSSMVESECVNRLNFAMMTTTEANVIKDQQVIIYIYEELFDKITILFSATLFDYHDPDRFTVEAMEIYSYQKLAVLEILNNMQSDQIAYVLKDVSNEYCTTHARTRFNLLNLSGDYIRVRSIAEYLHNSGYTMPR